MNEKIINEIVWWIPIKKLRNNIRELLLEVYHYNNTKNNIEKQLNRIINIHNITKYEIDCILDYTMLIADHLENNNFDTSMFAPTPKYKRYVIKTYAQKFNCHTFVETGTYLGDTTYFAKDYFKTIYTIELSKELFNKAVYRFKDLENIKVIHGDSSQELPKLLNNIYEKTLFWLDGHYCGNNTARALKDTPIMEELESIFKHKVKGHIILIDDIRCFGIGDYPTIKEIEDYTKSYNPNCSFEVKCDIARILL